MLKATAQPGAQPVGGPTSTKQRMVAAALECLKSRGFAGSSARAIAGIGGFNQALIFYHYGSVHELLLAALDVTSAQRMERYEAALQEARTVAEILATAREAYSEDVESGHITVLTELIAGSLSDPALAPRLVERMEPWIDLADRAIRKAVEGTPVAGLLPTRDLAFGIVAFYLGADLLTQLDGDQERARRLFDLGGGFAPLLLSLTGGSGGD